MLCLIAKLDEASTRCLMQLEKEIEEMGLPARELHGHITLATYVGEDEQVFMDSCRKILTGQKQFTVFYDQIEVMAPTWTLAVMPRKENKLSTLQNMVTRMWPDDLDRWTRSGVWKPHTTLMTLPHGDIYGAAEQLRKKFTPFSAKVLEIEFSRVEKEGYTILERIALL